MKYMGSKSRFAKSLLPIILKDRSHGQWYVEPFAGGMNMVCNVSGNVIASDLNFYLIEMWRALVKGWVPEKITKAFYDKVRASKNDYPPNIVGWIGFNCSYSGKWFGGFAGEVKTKEGVRDYQAEAIKNVLSQVEKMRHILLENKPYHELILPNNSIVYCDPPYESTTKYADGFDHAMFWDWIRKISNSGHAVFVSEYQAPPDFKCIWQMEANSSLSANGLHGGNKVSVEKLFIYNP